MTYIAAALRRTVIQRAGNCCEYCLVPQSFTLFTFNIDHPIAIKHRGTTTEDNLCLCCPDCNRHKGSDIGSIDLDTGRYTPLFNPRKHNWADHFRLEGPIIEPLTPEGRVTVFLLQFNDVDRVIDRALLIADGSYPCTPPNA